MIIYLARGLRLIFASLLLVYYTNINLFGQSLLEKLSDNFKRDFVATFESTVYDVISNNNLQASGKLYFKKGGLMRFEYIFPDEQLIVIGRDTVWIYDPILNNVTISSLDKVPAIGTLVFFREPDKLAKLFKIVPTTNNNLLQAMTGQKLLFLKSYAEDNQLGEIQLAYNSEMNLIEQLGIIDQQSNTRIFRFSEFEFPLDLVDEKFEFIIPKDVEIIEAE